MSDIQTKGARLIFNGEERNLYWDYAVIDAVQDQYGAHPIAALESMFGVSNVSGTEVKHYTAKSVLFLLETLLNTEVERKKYFEGKCDLKTYTRKQLGFLVDKYNDEQIVQTIIASWNESNPRVDEDDEKNA
jgi:hypothetical protein